MDAIQKVIEIAIQENGYLEKSKEAVKADPTVLDRKTDGAGKDNYQKYARDLAAVKYFNGSKQGVEWCAVFVSWCYFQAFGKDTALKLQCQPSSGNCGAGCSSAAKYYKSKGQFFGYPEPGDQVFFKASNGNGFGHTGLVEAVDGSKVYTIEGNTSSEKGVVANGGSVRRKSYALNSSKIGGYGRPNWSIVTDEKEDEDMPTESFPYNAIVYAASGTTVNFRKSPSSNATVLKAIPIGTIVSVLSYYNTKWACVQYMDAIGYMMREYLIKSDDTVPDTGEQPGTVTREEFDALVARVDRIEKFLEAG